MTQKTLDTVESLRADLKTVYETLLKYHEYNQARIYKLETKMRELEDDLQK